MTARVAQSGTLRTNGERLRVVSLWSEVFQPGPWIEGLLEQVKRDGAVRFLLDDDSTARILLRADSVLQRVTGPGVDQLVVAQRLQDGQQFCVIALVAEDANLRPGVAYRLCFTRAGGIGGLVIPPRAAWTRRSPPKVG